jgi:thiamine biosynthesis lipoprotein
MASPCECLIETHDHEVAKAVAEIAYQEVKRIEQKYSRYRNDNICFAINNSRGSSVEIDQETYKLLQFGQKCFEVSDGLFDLTSGVLRRIWSFKSNSLIPSEQQIEQLKPLIGWSKIEYDQNHIKLKKDMEIDFGGIGKEYAVDRSVTEISNKYKGIPVLVNFGGDLRVTLPPTQKSNWEIGVDSSLPQLKKSIRLATGAVCTSGDTERYIIDQGVRYGHILNPKTGRPVAGAPQTVTVIANNCLQAGLLATLAILQGNQAESFLTEQSVKFYCQR